MPKASVMFASLLRGAQALCRAINHKHPSAVQTVTILYRIRFRAVLTINRVMHKPIL